MYTTPEILIDKYGADLLIRLTVKNPTGEETAPDLAVLVREIGRVDGTIDGYLRGRYALPLEVPPELAGCAEDLAIDRLYRLMPERSVPEDVAKAAAAATAWLRDLQKGLATLSIPTLSPASTGGEPGGSGFFRTNKRPSDRLFSDAVLDRFSGRP